MSINDAPRPSRETLYASLIYSNRDAILAEWRSLLELDDADPAATFIRDQLDVSIIALAGWILGQDPANSTMSLWWRGIRPEPELVAGAVLSMSLMPQAVCTVLIGEDDVDHTDLASLIGGFTREVTTRILRNSRLISSDTPWDEVSSEVDSRYREQRAQRVRRLEALIEIAHAVSTGEDLDPLLGRVQGATARLFKSDYTEISLIDPHSGRLRCYLVHAGSERQHDLENTTIDEGLTNEVLERREAFAVNDYRAACHERAIPLSRVLDDAWQRGWMAAPMRLGDQVIGAIAVSSPLTSFDQEEIELLTAIAQQTATALENRRLINAQVRHVEQLSAVNSLARQIADVRDPQLLLDTAADLIHEYFNYGLVTILRLSPDGNRLTISARSPLSTEFEDELRSFAINTGSIVGSVAMTRTPARHDDIRDGVPHLTTRSTRTTRSEMAVPVIYAGRLLGVLDVQSDQIAAYDQHDVTTLQTIADQIAVGLENSRLFAGEARRSRDLQLMLRTARAAGSSLMLDEVLEHLASGIAEAAGATDCQIHLFDSEAGRFLPAARVSGDCEPGASALSECDRVLAASDSAEIDQAMSDPYPVWFCPLGGFETAGADRTSLLLIPLRTHRRTLGMAIVPAGSEQQDPDQQDQIRLIQGVADSAALAVENAWLYSRAHGLAVAEERGRLAQEIHDTLAQGLTAISLQLELADSYLPSRPEQASPVVRRALELSRQNLDEARRSVLDLRAADVHQMSLPDAISQLLRRLGDSTDLTFEFRNEGVSGRLSARVEVGLYRIIEEAVENARRHSGARLVSVTLSEDGANVSAVIEDDGQGFDPEALASQDAGSDGYGLVGIRERARLLGGSLTVSSNPGTGSRLRVVVPYEARQPTPDMNGSVQGEVR